MVQATRGQSHKSERVAGGVQPAKSVAIIATVMLA
jgi:hypothetical protein